AVSISVKAKQCISFFSPAVAVLARKMPPARHIISFFMDSIVTACSGELGVPGLGKREDQRRSEEKERGVESQGCADAAPVGDGSHRKGGKSAKGAPGIVDESLRGAADAGRIQLRQHSAEKREKSGAAESDEGADGEQPLFRRIASPARGETV